jgi:signal transduction histidine kinase
MQQGEAVCKTYGEKILAQGEKQNTSHKSAMPSWAWLLSGLCFLPLLLVFKFVGIGSELLNWVVAVVVLLLAPLPALLGIRRQIREVSQQKTDAEEKMFQLKLSLDEVRSRSAQLRDELQAADRAAKLTNQLAVLGQFTAGFMHEFNNPLAIVEGRIEVLLDERKEDTALHADLTEMLKETRYMARIAKTLLQALRQERSSEAYEPCQPAMIVQEILQKMRPKADVAGAELQMVSADVPLVDLPDHVLSEVLRGLVLNAFNAMQGQENGLVQIILESYKTAGSKVVVRVEDNGPGVPEAVQEHLFEPFVSSSQGREHLGLGLFLAASLLDMYDAKVRYEKREVGGACFVLELPATRYTEAYQYHWFQGGASE